MVIHLNSRRVLWVIIVSSWTPSVTFAQSDGSNPPSNSSSIGQSQSQGGHVDGRMDFWEYSGNEFLERYAAAVAFHVGSNQIQDNGDGTYGFDVIPWTEDMGPLGCNSTSTSLCPDVRFFGQPISTAPWFGSGAFLVGDDLVLLALHTFGGPLGDPDQFCADGRAFVFDHFQFAPMTGQTAGADSLEFPAENVYFCAEAVEIGGIGVPNDWALIRLDRSVPQARIPFRIRRNDVVETGTPVSVVGFPDRMPLKLERSEISSATGSVIRAPAFIRFGSSGGPVINEMTGEVEGLVRTGPTYLDCNEVDDCRADPEFTRQIAAVKIVSAKGAVPPVGLQVSPRESIEYYGPPGGPFTFGDANFVPGFTYQIDVPPATPGFLQSRTVNYTVTPDATGLVGVSHHNGLPQSDTISGTLEPGDVDGVVTSLLAPVLDLPIGAHDAIIEFSDDAYRAKDFRLHRILVGVEGFDLEPDEPFAGDGPGAQHGDEKTYVISNRYSVVQKVRATASDSWIKINGGQGPATYKIGPNIVFPFDTMNPYVSGHTATAHVSLDATGLPDGVHVGSVEFLSLFGGVTSTMPEIREVRLDVGRHYFSYLDAPLRIESPSVIEVPIVLPKALFEVVDLDIALDMEYLEGEFNAVTIVLRSPAGTNVLLFRGHSLNSPGVIVNTVFDDDTNPPPSGVGSLANFNGESTAGPWNLVVMLEGNENGAVMLNEFTLRLHYQPPKPGE